MLHILGFVYILMIIFWGICFKIDKYVLNENCQTSKVIESVLLILKHNEEKIIKAKWLLSVLFVFLFLIGCIFYKKLLNLALNLCIIVLPVVVLLLIRFVVKNKVNKIISKNEQEKMEKNEYVLQLMEKKTSLIRKIKWSVVVLYTGYTLFEMYRDCNSGSMFGGILTNFFGPFFLLGETVICGKLVCNLYNFIYYAIRSLREKNFSHLFVYSSLFEMSVMGIFICLVMIGVMIVCYLGLFDFFSNVDFCKLF